MYPQVPSSIPTYLVLHKKNWGTLLQKGTTYPNFGYARSMAVKKGCHGGYIKSDLNKLNSNYNLQSGLVL